MCVCPNYTYDICYEIHMQPQVQPKEHALEEMTQKQEIKRMSKHEKASKSRVSTQEFADVHMFCVANRYVWLGIIIKLA